MRRGALGAAAAVALAVWFAAVLAASARQARVDYRTQVQPIVARACLECHSQDRRKGGLSLATYSDALDGGRNGAVGPGYLGIDIRLGYRRNLPDGRTLDFFAETFNVSNQPNFVNPSGDRRLPTFPNRSRWKYCRSSL